MNATYQRWNETDTNEYEGFAVGPPPGGVYAWPGCLYPLPLPPRSIYFHATGWIRRTLPIFFIIFGAVGNVLCALVISRRFRKSSSTAVYLFSLALADTLVLFNLPLRNWLRSTLGYEITKGSNWFCKLSIFLTYSSFHISTWILVAVTIERAISVMCPYKVKRRCTQKNAIVIVFTIVTAFFCIDSHILHGFGTSPLSVYTGVHQCMPVTKEYATFYHYTWFWIHFCVGFTAPFVIIVVGNACVIHGLIKMRRRQKWIVGDDAQRARRKKDQHRGQRTRTTMILLILLSAVYLVSQSPIAFFLVYVTNRMKEINKLACSNFREYMLESEKLWFVEAVTFSFGNLNASFNFVLYVVSGSRFRQEIKTFLLCQDRRQVQSLVSSDSSKRQTENTEMQ